MMVAPHSHRGGIPDLHGKTSSCGPFTTQTSASLEVILGMLSWLQLKEFVILFFMFSIKQNALNILFCLFDSLVMY